jgi:hypothetical protein
MVGFSNRQEIDMHRGPAGNYNHLRRPLSDPPRGKYWKNDADTNEWVLADVEHFIQIGDDQENLVVDGQVIETNIVGPDDYIEHLVEEHDTFQGLCLRYKITSTELRQANGGFSGTNLKLAPNPLRITRNHNLVLVVNRPAEESTALQLHQESTALQLRQLKKTCPGLSNSEAKSYLELNDGNLEEAISNAQEDGFFIEISG